MCPRQNATPHNARHTSTQSESAIRAVNGGSGQASASRRRGSLQRKEGETCHQAAQETHRLPCHPRNTLPAMPPRKHTACHAAQETHRLPCHPGNTLPAMPPRKHTACHAAQETHCLPCRPGNTLPAMPPRKRTACHAAQEKHRLVASAFGRVESANSVDAAVVSRGLGWKWRRGEQERRGKRGKGV